jgi:DNA segregation ATPase FtsK/SpoIIIE-like protein
MEDHAEITALLKEIQANQQSLHDDMATVVDRLTKLEAAIIELTQHSNVPSAIDEHQLYIAARSLVVETGRASTSMIQRVLRIGYSRAASLMDALEANGIIGEYNGNTPRTVLMDAEGLEEIENAESEAIERKLALLNPELGNGNETDDELYEDARKAVIEAGKCSTSYLQRKLRIGYSRATRLMDMLEEQGVIGPQDGLRPREVKN